MKLIFRIAIITTLICCGVTIRSAHAEVKLIEADSTYIIGDNDTKIDARRIAIQEAKRKALENAGTFVESLTQVKHYQLTRDEINTYAAGILETEIIAEQMRGTPQHPEIYIKARCRIDTDVLLPQIEKFLGNEDLKEQLDCAAKENENLKKERDALIKQLSSEQNKTKAANTRQKLDTALTRAEANDDARSVWINIGPQLVEVDNNGQTIKQTDLDASSVILQRALKADPQNQRAGTLLAAIYQRNGNYTGAENEIRSVIQRNPSRPALHMKLGVLLKEQKKYEDALREFHFVERMKPKNPVMLFYTGMTYKDMGKCGMSVQYLNRFLSEKRSNLSPQKKEQAAAVIEECGGDRPGRHRRSRNH